VLCPLTFFFRLTAFTDCTAYPGWNFPFHVSHGLRPLACSKHTKLCHSEQPFLKLACAILEQKYLPARAAWPNRAARASLTVYACSREPLTVFYGHHSQRVASVPAILGCELKLVVNSVVKFPLQVSLKGWESMSHCLWKGSTVECVAEWWNGMAENQDTHRRQDFFWRRACTLFGLDPPDPPPPPTPPTGAPTQTKRVPICSFSNSEPFCILTKTCNWSVAELWGKNWDIDAHAHVTYQAPITG